MIDDAYNSILTVIFSEMLDRGITAGCLMQCITTAVNAEPDLTTEDRKTLLAVAGQANRLLSCAYNVHTESQAEYWEEQIDRLCGGKPPVSYIEHMEGE